MENAKLLERIDAIAKDGYSLYYFNNAIQAINLKTKINTMDSCNNTLFELILNLFFDGVNIASKNGWSDNDKKIFYRGICRLFQNKKDIKFTYPIHETVRESIKRLNGKIGKSGVVIYHYPKYDKDKKDYYLKLLKKKIKSYPKSNAKKELEIEEII